MEGGEQLTYNALEIKPLYWNTEEGIKEKK